MNLGLTAWFDPDGTKEKIFGIHCPLGVHDGRILKPTGRGIKTDEPFEKMIQDTQNELEISGSAHDYPIKLSLPDAESAGINCKLGISKGILVYELKVPLARSEQHPYAVGTEAGKTIVIGFEMGKPDRQNMKESMPVKKDTTVVIGEDAYGRRDSFGYLR